MRIGIQTWGSEGDVRPFLALADGLVGAGHDVRLTFSPIDGRDYAAKLVGAQYEHRCLASSRSPEDRRRIGGEIFTGNSPTRELGVFSDLLEPAIADMAQSASELAKWADVLVMHFLAHPLAAAAELERKPFVCAYVGGPMIPTRAFPPPNMPHLGACNLLTWKMARSVLSASLTSSANSVRARLGLGPVKRIWQQLDKSAIDLVALSPALLPRPADWPDKVHLCGSWGSPAEPQEKPLAAELETFLAEGPAPIYITFGSMSGFEGKPQAVAELVDRTLEAVGCRAIVQSGTPGRSSPRVLQVAATVHDRVFPRCAAIVHHGGAGTSQAALRAGRPSVVVAHLADQFMWGRHLHRLGVAPPHLTRRTLHPKRLARAIEQASQDAAMRDKAERLGQQMRMEDGVRRAVELISQLRDRVTPSAAIPPCESVARNPQRRSLLGLRD